MLKKRANSRYMQIFLFSHAKPACKKPIYEALWILLKIHAVSFVDFVKDTRRFFQVEIVAN